MGVGHVVKGFEALGAFEATHTVPLELKSAYIYLYWNIQSTNLYTNRLEISMPVHAYMGSHTTVNISLQRGTTIFLYVFVSFTSTAVLAH